MTSEDMLAYVASLTPEAREKLQRAIDDVSEVTILNLVFTRHGVDLLCTACEHDILITRCPDKYEVYIHDKSPQANVITGPFQALSRDFCVAWAKGRCGLLPDQINAQLKALLEQYAEAEVESHAEARIAYDRLAEFVKCMLGEQTWEDETIHTLRRRVGLIK